MAEARKCDRCQTCFDPMNMPEDRMLCRFKNPVFQSSDDVQNKRIGAMLMNRGTLDTQVDLCPECAEGLINFMYQFKKNTDDSQEKSGLCVCYSRPRPADLFSLNGITFGGYINLEWGISQDGLFLAAGPDALWGPRFCPFCGRKIRDTEWTTKDIYDLMEGEREKSDE